MSREGYSVSFSPTLHAYKPKENLCMAANTRSLFYCITLDMWAQQPYEIQAGCWSWDAQTDPRRHHPTGFLHVTPQSTSKWPSKQQQQQQWWQWHTPAGLLMQVWGPSSNYFYDGRAASTNCCTESSSSSLFSTTSSVLFIGTPLQKALLYSTGQNHNGFLWHKHTLELQKSGSNIYCFA